MLVDGTGMELAGSADFALSQVNSLPSGSIGQMIYLMVQEGENAAGPYVHNGTKWAPATTEEVMTGWWDDDATVVVDAANTVVGENQAGTSVLTNHVATDFNVGSFNVVNNEVRSNENCIRIDGSSSYIQPRRIGATVPWTNEGQDWTIEYVFKHISGNGGLDLNNFNSLNNRIQCAGGETTNAIKMQIFNNRSSARYTSGSTGINDGAWHHAAYTFNASNNQWKFWLDGILKATTTWAPILSTFNESISKYNGYCYLDRYQMVPRVKYTEGFVPAI